MAGRHDSLIALFRELAQLTVLEEGSPNAFRVRAYENALEAISSYRGDLGALTEKQLTGIGGIGTSTAKKIREFFEGGTIAKLEELRRKYPPELLELSRIPGVGPKTLLRLKSELGVANVDDLRIALENKRIREIRGLGAKVEENLVRAIERMGATGKEKRRPIAEAMPIAREFVIALEALPAVERARYCGSLRRLRETVADVDIVAASGEPAAVREAFVKMPTVREVLGSGDTKTSVLTTTSLQVDLRVVDPRQFGAACQYFTGSKAHNIKLRQRALARGWLLNEYGLSDAETGEVIASETEEAIYAALDLPCIPAPMREDRGEIEAAAVGGLPPAVRLDEVRGDLHVHTSLSGDGRSTLEEILASAAERGYEYLALTDHAENLAMSGVSREALLAQRRQIDALRGRYPSLTILHGSELNIGRDGSVDYDADFRRQLDWCVAGVHSLFDLDRAEQTRRILAVMDDPTVNAVAHLTGRRIGKRQGIDVDVDAVLRKAAETGIALEINASLGRLDLTSDVLFRARGMDVTFVLSTDTHHTRELERMQWGVEHATRGWVDPARIANLWPRERFLEWRQRQRERVQA
jgi:DNA polymerase (family 10)